MINLSLEMIKLKAQPVLHKYGEIEYLETNICILNFLWKKSIMDSSVMIVNSSTR